MKVLHQLQGFYLILARVRSWDIMRGNFDLNGGDVNTLKYHSTCYPQQYEYCKLVATRQYKIRYPSTSLSLMAEVFFGWNNIIFQLATFGDHISFEVQVLNITMSSEAVKFPTQAGLVMCAVRAFYEPEDLTMVSDSFPRELSVIRLSPISFCPLKQVGWVL